MSSGSRTSPMGTRARNLLDVYRHGAHHSGATSWSICTVEASSWARRTARPVRFSTGSRARVGVYQRELPPRFGREVPRAPGRRQEGDRLGAGARHEYGADTAWVFVAGSSAGGHLASLAGLTPSDPSFQPGFEHADTSVPPSSPYTATTAPSTRILATLHTVRVRPPRCAAVLRRAWRLRHLCAGRRRSPFPGDAAPVSRTPLCTPELPGAQHSFDLFHSIRFETLIDGIEAFAAWVS